MKPGPPPLPLQGANGPRRRTVVDWMPLALVAFTLIGLGWVVLLSRNAADLHRESAAVISPARRLIAEELAILATEDADALSYALTGATHHRVGFRAASKSSQRVIAELDTLARPLGSPAREHVAQLRASVDRWRALNAPFLSGQATRDEFIRVLPRRDLAFEAAIRAAERLDALLLAYADTYQRRGRELARFALMLTFAVVGTALATVLSVAYQTVRERRLVRQLRVTRDTLQAVFDASPSAIIALRLDRTVQLWNRAAELMFGWSADEVVGKPLPSIVPEEQMPSHYRFFTSALGGHGLQGVEIWRTRRDGASIALSLSTAPLQDPEGRLRGVLGMYQDITERKMVEDERERLLEGEREARERVTTILESITDAFIALDRDWKITYLNRAALRTAHHLEETDLGRDIREALPDLVGGIVGRRLERAVREEVPVHIVEYVAPWNAWFDIHAYPSREHGLSIYYRDVTRRKEAEEALRESEARLRTLTSNVPTVMIYQQVREPDGTRRYVYVSGNVERLNGVRADDVLRDPSLLWDQVLEEYRGEVEEAEERSLRDMSRFRVEFRSRLPGGTLRWFEQVSDPRLLPGGAIIWDGVQIDVTERKRAEEERARLLENERRAREELERVMESRSRLIRGFTHDVKNPLGAADGFAVLLEEGIRGELTSEQQESVHRIRRSIHTALDLIGDLLELARAEAGQVSIDRVTMDVAEATREIVDEYRPQAQAKGLSLRVHAPEGMPPVCADPARVRQVLGNLVSNAVKYTHEGEVEVRVEAPDGSRLAVRVRDTGPGIADEDRERVFEEFIRLEPGAGRGAGIGLSIGRRIARLMDGDVTLESEPGKGSTFTLWLPRAGSGASPAPLSARW